MTTRRWAIDKASSPDHASPRGIERALQGMAARRPVAAEIGTAGGLLSDHFDRFSADFHEFLRSTCALFRVPASGTA